MSNPLYPHWLACKRVLRYLKETTDYGLTLKKDEELEPVMYTVADWGSDPDDCRLG